jgi:membrane protease YdiL (CAAX protease family)
MNLAPRSAPPAGWYFDPWRRATYRWWDGQAWSWQVHPLAAPPPRPLPPPEPPAPTLPIAAGLWGLLAITAVLIALHILAALAAGHLPVVPGVILVSFALYGPMAGFCFYASRRWGTGRVRADLGVRAKPVDAAIGLAVAFIALQAERIALLLVEILHLPVRSNTEGVSISDDRGLYLTLAAVAIVAAPLVEELFFRGLLLSALRSRLGPVAAVAVQAAVFGAYHASPNYGTGNVGLVVILAAVGVVFGATAQLTRRLGPSMVAHALLNATVFLVLLATT